MSFGSPHTFVLDEPPTSTRRARPAGRRAEAREQAILDAAVELLVEVGYERLSMDGLAERAHASKATIYRHWSGKAEIVAEALRGRAHEHQELADLGELRADLLALVAGSCATLAEDGPLVAAVVWAMRADPVLASLMRENIVEEVQSSVEQLVRRAVERGELIRGDAALVADVLLAMVLQRLLLTDEPLDDAFRLRMVDEVAVPLLTRDDPARRSDPTTTQPTGGGPDHDRH